MDDYPERPERLEPLKTLHETRANDQYVEALVFEMPAKLASKALGIVKPVLQEAPKQPQLHHLRRVIHQPHLPQDLLMRRVVVTQPNKPCVFLIQVAPQDLADAIMAAIKEAMDQDPTLADYDHVPRCFPIPVPLHAPLNETQAKDWTERHWPCIYNPAAQLLQDAPPLHLLRKIRMELETVQTDNFITLAQLVAEEASTSGRGLGVGAVVVDPVTQQVIAAAGDARYHPGGKPDPNDDTGGRPEWHALMRVISMVANKELRRRLAAGSHQKFAATCSEGLPGQAVSATEQYYLDHTLFGEDADSKFPGYPPRHTAPRAEGYLCSNLDIYITHEPCVCCAMAMVHSRFRACVLINRMQNSGALCARTHQSLLGYGLFWRRELNWRVLTFRYKDSGHDRGSVLKDMFHA
ncbi:tRNA-specific adenosine deaminase subunit tad3 [Exophiala xenobiotica]|uniref:tRNA-specific adenosine deaminase subunit tad3 n=1 Tax=Lithohypha guttulata TaxID=1690604 RepID=A0ABR0KHQ7_9EURO|nr:tRNA-specific adenosine deaminase subunit tad3 [Lithohypha guttulata]KAK5316357.1 tRNA-specific adenosine deaminase subunit tad3 [Exophiala xenobiotica]